MDLERDLVAWEQGTLTREELVARHGDGATSILRLHDELIRGASTAPVDIEASWQAFASRLDEPAPVIRLPHRRVRTALLAVAAAVMLAGSAIAVVGPRVGDEPERIVPPVTIDSGGGLGGTPATDRDDVRYPLPAGESSPGEGNDEGTEAEETRDPAETPVPDHDEGQEEQSEGPQGGATQGDDHQGEDAQGDDPQGDQGDDSQGDQGSGDRSGDSQDDQGSGDEGDQSSNEQGAISDPANGDSQGDQD
jgi:hypothetical protein